MYQRFIGLIVPDRRSLTSEAWRFYRNKQDSPVRKRGKQVIGTNFQNTRNLSPYMAAANQSRQPLDFRIPSRRFEASFCQRREQTDSNPLIVE